MRAVPRARRCGRSAKLCASSPRRGRPRAAAAQRCQHAAEPRLDPDSAPRSSSPPSLSSLPTTPPPRHPPRHARCRPGRMWWGTGWCRWCAGRRASGKVGGWVGMTMAASGRMTVKRRQRWEDGGGGGDDDDVGGRSTMDNVVVSSRSAPVARRALPSPASRWRVLLAALSARLTSLAAAGFLWPSSLMPPSYPPAARCGELRGGGAASWEAWVT